jgi:DNA transformation protein
VTISQDYIDFVSEQLDALRGLQCKRMFGGAAMSADGLQFALLMDNATYFLVDDATRPVYEAMGRHCFSYATRLRHVEVKRYYEVPGELIEDRERLASLARESLGIAVRERSKPARRKAKGSAR